MIGIDLESIKIFIDGFKIIRKKETKDDPMIISDKKSLTIPSKPVATDSSVIPLHHKTRKVARQTRFVFN